MDTSERSRSDETVAPPPEILAALSADWSVKDAVLAGIVLTLALTTMREANYFLPAIDDGLLLIWVGDSIRFFAINAFFLFLVGFFVFLTERYTSATPFLRIVSLTSTVAIAGVVGGAMQVLVVNSTYPAPLDDSWRLRYFDAMVARYAFVAAGICLVRVIYQRLVTQASRTHRMAKEHIAAERDMAEARLQVLQSQVEPHFLFNTLANVRRLYQTDRSSGRAMLDNLMRYLTAALPQMRAAQSTLRRELSLTEAFLQIHRIRMGNRLHYAIHAPEVLGECEVPTMMLLTLVENAVKHGLNPLIEGGSIAITAYRESTEGRDALLIHIADDGQGFQVDAMGVGVGLSNMRARLALMTDARAHLTLEANHPRGVIATLSIPCDAAPACQGEVTGQWKAA